MIYFEKIVRNLSRFYKYSLERIECEELEIVGEIIIVRVNVVRFLRALF